MGIQMNPIGIFEYIFINLKINGCRCRDNALRCFARFRNRGRFARAIADGKIVRQHQGFFLCRGFLVRVGRILCRGFLVRVGRTLGQNGFFLVLGIAWQGGAIPGRGCAVRFAYCVDFWRNRFQARRIGVLRGFCHGGGGFIRNRFRISVKK